MSPPLKARRQVLHYRQISAIVETVKLHAKCADGFVSYNDGWTDIRISREIPDEVWADYSGPRLGAVQRVRLRELGETRPYRLKLAVRAALAAGAAPFTPQTPAPNSLEARMADVDRRLRLLERARTDPLTSKTGS